MEYQLTSIINIVQYLVDAWGLQMCRNKLWDIKVCVSLLYNCCISRKYDRKLNLTVAKFNPIANNFWILAHNLDL